MSTFPLCCEPRHEAPIRRLVDGCVEFVRAQLGPERLAGVVLTGSFARGEGSVLSSGGRLKVLGDIEFFVVLRHPADYRRLRPRMAGWGPVALAALGADQEVQAEVEFGPVHVGYLQRAQPSIFIYDLRYHGKVLWGPPDLLDTMPSCVAGAIPREDALRLLFNRTIEQLGAYDRIARLDGDAAVDVAYQQVKIVLDLAGSALAFSGVHCPSYAERPARLARLLRETPSLARRLPAQFPRDLAQAARVKLAPDDHDFAAGARDGAADQGRALRAQIVAAAPAMLGLLRWELEQLLGGDADLEGAGADLEGAGADLDGLLDRYLATQSLARRAWEWGKLAVNPLPAPLPLSAPAAARLFWRSTPRALIYAAGALAYRDLHERRPERVTLEPPLPLTRAASPRDPEARRRAIVALWRWCVRNS